MPLACCTESNTGKKDSKSLVGTVHVFCFRQWQYLLRIGYLKRKKGLNRFKVRFNQASIVSKCYPTLKRHFSQSAFSQKQSYPHFPFQHGTHSIGTV